MEYKKYCARVEFDAEDRIFTGHIAGIRDIVGFHGSSVEELENNFREAVDSYISHYEKLGLAPQHPYTGKIMLRLAPEIHAALAARAEAAGKSLNQWATEALSSAI
jgi:predicted HicB family RNase H-like nuclease